MDTRRDFLKQIGTMGLAYAVAGCATTNDNKYSSIEDALGPRWDELSFKEKRESRKVWGEYPEEEKELLSNFYNQTSKLYGELDEKGKNRVDNLISEVNKPDFKDHEDYGDFEEIESYFPWISLESFEKSDALLVKDVGEAIAYGLMAQ